MDLNARVAAAGEGDATVAAGAEVDLSRTGMSLTFLGTSSGIPTLERNVSSVALQWSPRDVYLVRPITLRASILTDAGEQIDCGDGTQRQLLRAGIPFARLRGVFITHLHGDHVYGLVALLAMITMRAATVTDLFVVGPRGIRRFLEDQFVATDLRFGYRLQIVEVDPDTTAPVVLPAFADRPFAITSCPLKHRIACVGYVFAEHSRRNFDAPAALARGVRHSDLGRLAKGDAVVSATTGETISKESCMGDPIAGRVIVVLGDTCNSDSVLAVASGADVIVHEATYDATMQDKAVATGHSTSRDAGLFAHRLRARRLIITHFSARYSEGDEPLDGQSRRRNVEKKNTANLLAEAREAATDAVLVEEARDFAVFHIPPRGKPK